MFGMRFGLGLGASSGNANQVGLSFGYAATAAYYDALPEARREALDQTDIDIMDAFIGALINAGAWDKLDAVYLFCTSEATGNFAATSQAAYNVKNPTAYNIAPITPGEHVLEPYKGVRNTKNANTTGGLNTGFVIVAGEGATLMQTSDACILVGEYLRSASGQYSLSQPIGGSNQYTYVKMYVSSTDYVIEARLNTSNAWAKTIAASVLRTYDNLVGIFRRSATLSEAVYAINDGAEASFDSNASTSNTSTRNLHVWGSASVSVTSILNSLAFGAALSRAQYLGYQSALDNYLYNIRARYYGLPVIINALARVDWQYNDDDYADEEIGVYTVVQDSPYANTGLGYKRDSKQIVCARYRQNVSSEILLYDRSDLIPYTEAPPAITPTPTQAINITAHIDYLQGVDYDDSQGVYYCLGTRKGYANENTNRTLVVVDESGAKVRETVLSAYSFEPGMLQVVGDYLYVTVGDTYQFDKNTMSEIRHFSSTGGGDEGIGVHKATGNFWKRGGESEIKEYTKENILVDTYTLTTYNDQIEGIMIDPADDTVWVNADNSIHGQIANGNRLWHYDYKKTYGKFVRFPEMVRWDEGTLGTGLSVSNNQILGSGVWTSPIMDFGEHTDFISNAPTATHDSKAVSYRYRGSNTAPSGTAYTEMSCHYYSGWGTTDDMTEWDATPPAKRYIQIEITIN